jgi:hypothetical protein
MGHTANVLVVWVLVFDCLTDEFLGVLVRLSHKIGGVFLFIEARGILETRLGSLHDRFASLLR